MRKTATILMIASGCLLLGSYGLDFALVLRNSHATNRTTFPFTQREKLFMESARLQSRIAPVTRWTSHCGRIPAALTATTGTLALVRRHSQKKHPKAHIS